MLPFILIKVINPPKGEQNEKFKHRKISAYAKYQK